MNKQTFLEKLRKGLSSLPKDEIEERLNFYSEMIADRQEEGYTEEEAVALAGNLDEIITQILSETPAPKTEINKNSHNKTQNIWLIILLILGFPIWFPILIAVFAIVFSVYVTLWSVIVALWSVFGAIIGCAVGGIIGGSIIALNGSHLPGFAILGAGIVCSGVAILFFFGCKFATKGLALLTYKPFLWIKSFIRKEAI